MRRVSKVRVLPASLDLSGYCRSGGDRVDDRRAVGVDVPDVRSCHGGRCRPTETDREAPVPAVSFRVDPVGAGRNGRHARCVTALNDCLPLWPSLV